MKGCGAERECGVEEEIMGLTCSSEANDGGFDVGSNFISGWMS